MSKQKGLRQGDVLLVPVQKTRAQTPAKPDGDRVVLAYGEATGHHHSFPLSERVTMFRDDGSGGSSLVVKAPTALEHQEHRALVAAPGTYDIEIQRTFAVGTVRQVVD